MQTVLVIDDDATLRDTIGLMLETEGFRPVLAEDGKSGIKQAMALKPDLVLVDLRMPGLTGIEVCKQMRSAGMKTPLIVLSAIGDEMDKVLLLEIGADDYVVKPFGMAELLARIRAALRRRVREEAPEPVFQTGGLEVDLIRRTVAVDGTPVKLSAKQYKLLQILVGHAGKVVTHHQLLTEIWGPAHANDVHYLRIFVRKLRMKIEPEPSQPKYLATELGVGYRLRTQDQIDGGF